MIALNTIYLLGDNTISMVVGLSSFDMDIICLVRQHDGVGRYNVHNRDTDRYVFGNKGCCVSLSPSQKGGRVLVYKTRLIASAEAIAGVIRDLSQDFAQVIVVGWYDDNGESAYFEEAFKERDDVTIIHGVRTVKDEAAKVAEILTGIQNGS